ncbi:hypothetical protein RAG72_26330, partial [Klebsiella pneumoniae]
MRKLQLATSANVQSALLAKKAVHPGITCEEAAANSEDSQIEDLLLSQNWKKCPTCGVPVEKIDGCQFVTCTSPLCKGSNA